MSPAMAVSALQWWADAGVDCLVDEEPRGWLRPRAADARAITAPAAPDAAETLPSDLPAFQIWLRTADPPFAATSAPRLLPEGDPASGVMMIIDMPAAEDCTAGALLSGDAGRLFDRMLAAIGRDRSSIYLAPLSCLRPPIGRLGPEAARCAALARHHIALVAPKVVLLFGEAPAQALLGLSMPQARGEWRKIFGGTRDFKTLVTMPPALLLQFPARKADAWADLQLLMEGLR